jgi:hypothetical protein
MRSFLSAAILCCLLGTAFGQGRQGGQYWSLGGYGNVLYPGTGHAPATPPGGVTGPHFAAGFAARQPVLATPLPAAHPQHRRTAIVPYPVYYGGYGSGYGYDQSQGYAPGYGDQQPTIVNTNSVPSVVINQNFVPPQANPQVRDYGPSDNTGDDDRQSGTRFYQAPSGQGSARSSVANNGDEPTLYLIAFKDHSIVQALGYWMEGATLHYVSAEHSLNQASLDMIDRDLSQRLNAERNIEFKLPAAR